jgi:flap endonuclease-1
MGIKNLNKILKKKCKNSGIKEINILSLKNSYIGIDTSIFIYKYHENLILNFVNQILHFLKYEITPIYIFDGKPSKKDYEMEKRQNNKYKNYMKISHYKLMIELLKKFDNLNDDILDKYTDKIKRIKKRIIIKNKNEIKLFKKILDLCGIYYYQCNDETDLYVKSFFNYDIIDYVITEDTDFITYGCKKILYNYHYKNKSINLYNHGKILEDLCFTNEQFIDMCILMGCDYIPKVKNIGPMHSYNFIKKYKNIETIIQKVNNKKYKFSYEFNFQFARDIFNNSISIDIDRKDVKIKKKENYNELISILYEKEIKVNIINRLVNKLTKLTNKPKTILSFLKK